MSAAISPSDPAALQRSHGAASIAFKRRGAATVLDRLRQQGCAKIRLPHAQTPGHPQAVLLNTAGGLTGGDRFELEAIWAGQTCATVTTQAAERLYRSSAGRAEIRNRLCVGDAALAFWLPQETIVFDGAAVERRLDVDLEGEAALIAVESWMIGRAAMGETVRQAHLRDHWRIRRDHRLVFADGLRLSDDVQNLLDRPAIAQGHRCFATLLASPFGAGALLDQLRRCLAGAVAACSIVADVLVARLVAPEISGLRRLIAQIVSMLGAARLGRPMELPRVWNS